ncbi:MAG: NAD(P)/FAD-dependent oxidoreductase [Halioglobus sp.]
MDRRTLLKLLAAVSVTGCGTQPANDKAKLRVIVAGAGIVGASIAYHLAKLGISVTVIDKEGPATHASRGTFAWINATWAKQPRHYHELSQAAVESWKALQGPLALPVRWGGSLEWFANEARAERLAQQIAEQRAWGEPAQMLSASAVHELEPNLLFEPGMQAAFSPNDGAVDPLRATHALLSAAQQLGATVRFPVELTGANLSDGRLASVETTSGTITADRLVLATGAAPELPLYIAGVDIPQRSTPGFIALTKPMPRLINRIIVAPGVHMHQRDDGRVVLGEQEGAPDTEAHALRLRGRPNRFPLEAIAREHGERTLAVAKRFVPAMRSADIESAYIGWRPLPIDGHPVLGASPHKKDVYLAIMHSGVTLAPLVGQLVAQELALETAIEGLESYRPSRTFDRVQRY